MSQVLSEDDIRVRAYYLWLHDYARKLYTERDEAYYWYEAEKLAKWAICYKLEAKAYWELVDQIRAEKERDGYQGDLTVSGRPPVYGSDTDERFKVIQDQIRKSMNLI